MDLKNTLRLSFSFRLSLFIICLSFVLLVIPTAAQWESVGGPDGGVFYNLQYSDTVPFAKTSRGYHFYEKDSQKWTRLNEVIPQDYYYQNIVKHKNAIIILLNGHLNDSTQYKMIRTKDNGQTWEEIGVPPLINIRDVMSNEYGVYVQGTDGIFFSTDQGETWKVSSFHFNLSLKSHIYSYNGNIFITDSASLYRSAPDADTWKFSAMPAMGNSWRLYAFDSLYFAISQPSNQLFVSSNAGESWINSQPRNWENSNFVQAGGFYYGYINNLLYRSTNKGISFSQVNSDTIPEISELGSIHDSLVFISKMQLFIADYAGANRTFFDRGIDASWIWSIEMNDIDFWMTVEGKGIVKMNKLNPKFNQIEYFDNHPWDVLLSHNDIYATNGKNYLIKSGDYGAHWTELYFPFFSEYELHFFSSDSSAIYLTANGPEGNVMFKKDDLSGNWDKYKITDVDWINYPSAIFKVHDYSFALYEDKIARKKYNGAWEIVATGNSIYRPLIKFIPGDKLIGYIENNDNLKPSILFISSDFGTTWKKINTDSLFPNDYSSGIINVLFIDHTIVAFCGYPYDRIFISYDVGESWQDFNQGKNNEWIDEFLIDENYIYASTYGKGIYRRKITDLIPTSTTSIPSGDFKLNLFPNPTRREFTAQIPDHFQNEGTIFISDLNGHCLKHVPYKLKDLLDIDVSDFPPAMYLVYIQSANNLLFSKIVISQ